MQDNYKMEDITTKNNLYLTEDDESLQIASKCWERVINAASKVHKKILNDQIFLYIMILCVCVYCI